MNAAFIYVLNTEIDRRVLAEALATHLVLAGPADTKHPFGKVDAKRTKLQSLRHDAMGSTS